MQSQMQPAPLLDVWRALGGGPIRSGPNSRWLRESAFWRNSTDRNIALNFNTNTWRDHVAGCGGGPVSLVMHVLDCGPRDAGRWLREHFDSSPRNAYRPAPIPRQETNEAELIRLALIWHIESQLELAALVLWGPFPGRSAVRIRRLTRQLERVRAWTAQQAISRLKRLGRRSPGFIEYLYREAEDFQTELAQAIRGAAA